MRDEAETDPQIGAVSAVERRGADRVPVALSVDCETEATFLYASIRNISELGIFVATRHPLLLGTRVTLKFSAPRSTEAFSLGGVVQWINPSGVLVESPNPGMGVRFVDITLDDRERLVAAIRTIAYVRDASN